MSNESGFLDRGLTHAGTTYRYVVYVPAGERGNDGFRQIEVGLGRAIRWQRERFPMIVVFPHAPPDTRWLGDEADFAMMALERAITE